MSASAEAPGAPDESGALRDAADWAALPRAHGAPLLTGRIRSEPEDFIVVEELPFPLAGTGEHLYLRLRKRGDNTRWIARRLAAAFGLPPVAIGYAGLKDRHAVAEQWFSVHLPGRDPAELPELPGVTVLERVRHTGKLRVGAVAGNRFRLRIRGLDAADAGQSAASRLHAIAAAGVPNYFGPQRFGRDAGNLDLLRQADTRDREARAFGLSALRSALFNGFLAGRVADASWDRALDGEIAGRGWPAAGLLWGVGPNHASGAAALRERAWFESFPRTRALLEGREVRMSRRALGVRPEGLAWRFEADALVLEFGLPKGAYATAVLRELGEFADAAAAPEPG